MGQTIVSPAAKGRELKRDDITCKITYCAVGKNNFVNNRDCSFKIISFFPSCHELLKMFKFN